MRTVSSGVVALVLASMVMGCSPDEPADEVDPGIGTIEQAWISGNGCSVRARPIVYGVWGTNTWQGWAEAYCPKEPPGVEYSITFTVAVNHRQGIDGPWTGDRAAMTYTVNGNKEVGFYTQRSSNVDSWTDLGCCAHRSKVKVGTAKECQTECCGGPYSC